MCIDRSLLYQCTCICIDNYMYGICELFILRSCVVYTIVVIDISLVGTQHYLLVVVAVVQMYKQMMCVTITDV